MVYLLPCSVQDQFGFMFTCHFSEKQIFKSYCFYTYDFFLPKSYICSPGSPHKSYLLEFLNLKFKKLEEEKRDWTLTLSPIRRLKLTVWCSRSFGVFPKKCHFLLIPLILSLWFFSYTTFNNVACGSPHKIYFTEFLNLNLKESQWQKQNCKYFENHSL